MSWTSPPTIAVGDPATAGWANTTVRDNLNYLKGDANWTAPSLINSWANLGGSNLAAGYKRSGDMVQLRGVIASGTTNTVAFVLPVGYRPLGTVVLLIADGGGGVGQLTIDTSGNVKPVTITGNVTTGAYLDGLEFSTV